MPGRTALALALALAAVGAPASALADQTSTLSAGATLLDQPKGRPWAIGLDVKAAIATADGSQPSQLQKLQVKFPHATVNWNDFGTCQLSKLQDRKGVDGCPAGPRIGKGDARGRGVDGCPAGSRIGKGDAQVMARPLFPDPIPATIDVFNGQAKNGGRQILFLARTTSGLSVQLVFAGVLKKVSGGPYGFTLDVPLPRIPTVPPFDDASVVGFTIHVQARKRKGGQRVSYI